MNGFAAALAALAALIALAGRHRLGRSSRTVER